MRADTCRIRSGSPGWFQGRISGPPAPTRVGCKGGGCPGCCEKIHLTESSRFTQLGMPQVTLYSAMGPFEGIGCALSMRNPASVQLSWIANGGDDEFGHFPTTVPAPFRYRPVYPPSSLPIDVEMASGPK